MEKRAAFILFALILIHSFQPSANSAQVPKLDLELPSSYTDGCHLTQNEFKPKPCFYGIQESSFTVYLIGDSHAAQWLPGLIEFATKKKWRIRSMTKSGCPAAFLPMYKECEKWNEEILLEVRKNRPDLIFVSNLTNASHGIVKSSKLYSVYFRSGFTKMLSELSSLTKVKLIEDTPYPDFDINKCYNSKGFGKCTFSKNKQSITLISKLVARKTNVQWISTANLFCQKDTCIDSIMNMNLYRDLSHISSFASKLFNPIFKSD